MPSVKEMKIENLLAAMDELFSGIAIYGPNFELEYMNEACYAAFPDMFGALKDGKTMVEAIIESVRHTIPPEQLERVDFDAIAAEHIRKVKSGEPFEAVTSDGHHIKASHAPIPGGGYIGVSTDVTELRERERQLRHARKEALAASQAKSEFLATMSHEIRTPLNGILGMAQVLSGRSLLGEEKEMVDAIVESSKSLMTVLNDILDLSKIEAGKLDLSPIPDDLRHKLSRVSKVHRSAAEEKGLYFKLVVDPNVPNRLVFDPVRVRQCVDNLVSNAIKFTDEGGIIIAATSEPLDADHSRHKIKIHVSDTGVGISDEAMSNLFQNFQQADSSTSRRYGGTGLGLAIARRLSRMMGGDLNAVSKPGAGSVFTLEFEAGAAEDAIPRVQQRRDDFTPVDINAEPASLRGYRLLVVDDNGINRRVARLFLEPHGFVITEAQNGEDALEALSGEPYDLVLLDIHMPIMDGPETLKHIRGSSASWSDMPVIALTADAMSGDRERYVAMGMTDYVSKPIDERQLMGAISSALNGRPRRGGTSGVVAPKDPELTELFDAMSTKVS